MAPEPGHAVVPGGQEEPVLHQRTQHQTQEQGRARPVQLVHDPPQGPKHQHDDQIREGIFLGKRPDIHQEQDTGINRLPPELRDFRQRVQKEQADRHRDDIGDDDDPDKGEGQAEAATRLGMSISGPAPAPG